MRTGGLCGTVFLIRSRLYAAFLVRLSLLPVCLPSTCDYIISLFLEIFN
nr:MAG TPA: hypothetical protein [Caudoviricetes sp.]